MRLLIGTDSEQAAVIRAANEIHQADPSMPLLVLLGSASSFSFKPRPSTILVPGMPAGVIAAVPSLEELGIASRLASEAGLPGCYDGPVVELAQAWLGSITDELRMQTRIFVSKGTLATVAAEQLAQSFGVQARSIEVVS